jgi:ElaB/YqjD/DUF883 family membrane-anchored ribosome-binding protein
MATTSDMAPNRPAEAAANAVKTTRGRGKRAAAAVNASVREQELESQVAKLQGDIKSITDTLGKLTNAKVDEAKAVATTEFRQLKAKGEEMLGDAQDQAAQVEKQLKDTIREKPLTAVATAMGIGFVLALLTRH